MIRNTEYVIRDTELWGKWYEICDYRQISPFFIYCQYKLWHKNQQKYRPVRL